MQEVEKTLIEALLENFDDGSGCSAGLAEEIAETLSKLAESAYRSDETMGTLSSLVSKFITCEDQFFWLYPNAVQNMVNSVDGLLDFIAENSCRNDDFIQNLKKEVISHIETLNIRSVEA